MERSKVRAQRKKAVVGEESWGDLLGHFLPINWQLDVRKQILLLI